MLNSIVSLKRSFGNGFFFIIISKKKLEFKKREDRTKVLLIFI